MVRQWIKNAVLSSRSLYLHRVEEQETLCRVKYSQVRSRLLICKAFGFKLNDQYDF
jgi:hypothetical protein